MSRWLDPIATFLHDEDGPTAVEYAVMLALIIVVCVTAVTTLGANAREAFLNASLRDALTGGGGN